MAEDSFQEKTEEATEHKLSKAREEGQVAKSMEIPAVVVVLSAIVVLYLSSKSLYQKMTGLLINSFKFNSIPDMNLTYCFNYIYEMGIIYLLMLTPVLSAVFLAGFISNVFQVGFFIHALKLNFSVLNVIKGFARIFSTKSIVELFKSIMKIGIISLISYSVIIGEMKNLFLLHDTSVGYILLYIFKISFKIFLWVTIVLAVIAILDYAYQKWTFSQEMMMSKQEIKDEFKQMEGDPQVKARIRAIQREAAKKRMMQEVPKADVVVTNPTHLAIAIKYDPLSMPAPKVLAKGAGKVAEKIKEIAKENRIPVVENKELAQNLYKLVEVDKEIPAQFYVAVAQLLAYVYKLKGKKI